MSSAFVLESADHSRFAMFGTTDDGKLIPIFQTQDAAATFIQSRQPNSDLIPHELNTENIVAWMENAKQAGATAFTLNPPAACRGTSSSQLAPCSIASRSGTADHPGRTATLPSVV